MTNGLRLATGTDADAPARVEAAFAEFAAAHGLPPSVRRSVSVALDELLTNVRVHGFGGQAGGGVTVEVALHPDRVAVTVTDDGPPFDPLRPLAPDTALPVTERPVGGLGLHLVRQMMDEVSYERRGGRNVVVLAKRWRGGSTTTHPGGTSMQLTTRTQQGVTLVAVAGKLDSNTSPTAQQALEEILAGGARTIVLDCTALDYISSAGLRVLLGAAKRLTGSGGALRLFGLNESVREVFEISGFATILAVFATEAEALAGR